VRPASLAPWFVCARLRLPPFCWWHLICEKIVSILTISWAYLCIWGPIYL
jgi:hypothetical protein